MSCPAEWEVGAYVDGGLAGSELRALEAHLVGCERCRVVVLTLRDETQLLNAALRGAPVPAAAAPVIEAPAAGVAIGLPLALGLSLAATTAVSLLFDARLPSGLGWLHPSRLLGVNEMILDTIFALRSQASGWLEFGVALALLASLAAIGSFAASLLLRRVGGAALLALPLVLFAPGDADAKPELRRGDSVRIGAEERVDSSLVVQGDDVTLDGSVAGDLLSMSEHLAVRGVVEGNLIASGHDVEITGEVRGNVLVFAGEARIEGKVLGNVYAVADTLTLARGASVAGDMANFADRVRVEGDVARDYSGFGNDISVTGSIGRDLTTWADEVQLESTARVGRNLEVHLEAEEDLRLDPAAVVSGETQRIHTEDDIEIHWGPGHLLPEWELHLLLFTAALVFGLALHLLVPGVFRGSVATGEEFFVALGLGALALIGVPIALFFVGITLIGIPVALLGGAAYCVALYLGGIVVAVLIGRTVTRIRSDRFLDFGLVLVVGLLLFRLLTLIPLVGVPAWVILHLVGLGLLVRAARAGWRAQRSAA